MDERILAAYHDTSYVAETPAGSLRIRIGEAHADLDTLLNARGLRHWAFVTAHNPRSEPSSDDQNRTWHTRLQADVAARGYETWPGEGVGDSGEWPPETSLLILGMPRAEAIAVGLAHAQNAVVWGEIGEPALLLICTEHAAEPVSAVPPPNTP